jgi:Domain of unknown function (DUF4350)
MRPRRIAGVAAWVVLIGGFLALLFFGLQTFRMRLETGDSYPEYSTYRSDPKGLKAFYESLQTTDLIQVSRRLQSSKILPSGENQVLVVAGVRADPQTASDEDSQLFDHWLATGGRLIVALRPEKIQPTKNQPAPGTNQEATDNTSFVLWRSLIRRWGAKIAPLSDLHSATAKSPLFGTIARWLGRNSFDRLMSDWKIIAVQSDKDVIIERAFAHGSLVLLADSYPLSNEALAADRNTDFLLWLIDNRRGVLFDETHLGLSERPGIMTLARRYGLQGTLISIVAVLLLFIWKCQYTLVPRTKIDQDRLTVSGGSSDQAFLNLLPRAVSQKDLLAVCITTWLKTAQPTPAQLASLEKFLSDSATERSIVEGYNHLTRILHTPKKL